MSCDGAPVERLADVAERPLMSVFLPDRLELVKGSPGAPSRPSGPSRGRHLAARAGDRREYARVLSQRNALLARIRSGAPRERRCPPGTASSPRTGARVARASPRGRRAAARTFARRAAQLGVQRERDARLPPGPGPGTRTSSWPSFRRAWSSTCGAASPPTVRTVTSWRSCATGASCASTAHRASSDWPCSHCSWPSAR